MTQPTPPALQPQPEEVLAASPPAVQVRLSFWQTRLGKDVLPFMISLLMHTSIVVLGLLLGKAIKDAGKAAVVEQVIIPEAEFAMSGPPGGIPHPGLGGDPTRDAAQSQFPDVPRDVSGIAEKPGLSALPELMGGADAGEGAPGGIGLDVRGAKVAGAGRGSGIGGSGDSSGALAPFGVPGGGGGIGRKSNFIGVGGNARRIVYVVDATGDMTSIFLAVQSQLLSSIERLVPSQSFNVIFFQEGKAIPFSKTGLVPASRANKDEVKKFIFEITPRPITAPLPAIRMAFAQKPELIYVLTNGFQAPAGQLTPEEVENEFRKLNADKRVKVNMLLVTPGKTSEEYLEKDLREMVKRVAEESGGIYKHLNTDSIEIVKIK